MTVRNPEIFVFSWRRSLNAWRELVAVLLGTNETGMGL